MYQISPHQETLHLQPPHHFACNFINKSTATGQMCLMWLLLWRSMHFERTGFSELSWSGSFFSQLFLFHGLTALVGLGILIIEISRSHSDTLHSVWLLWTSNWPVAGTSVNTQHSQETSIHGPSRSRTSSCSKRADVDPRFRLHGHQDRLPHYWHILYIKEKLFWYWDLINGPQHHDEFFQSVNFQEMYTRKCVYSVR